MRTHRRKHLSYWVVVLLLATLALAACGAKESTQPQKDIIGSWKSGDGTVTLNYTADGMVTSGYASGGLTQTTNPVTAFTDATHVLGVWGLYPDLQPWEVHIRGDQMTVKSKDGKEIKFSRTQ